MSTHNEKNVSINEIEMALEKNVDSVNERERLLESCKHEIQKHQDPLDMLQERDYREVVNDAISLADGIIHKEAVINRIKGNHSLIAISFLSITQAKYQFRKIIEAINTEINKFTGRECIIHGYSYPQDDEMLGHVIDEPIPESIDEFQVDDEPTPKNNDEFQNEKHPAIIVYIVFINTEKGRAQLESLRKAINAELDKLEEKGLIGSYNSNDKGTESDLISDYTKEEIQDIEKQHNVQIPWY